jgi:hypothetical protein
VKVTRSSARTRGLSGASVKIPPNISDFAERAPTPTEPHQSAGRDGRGVAPHDPHFQWYEMGEPPAGEATYLFASSVSSLRYINEHANPAGVHYPLVLVSVEIFERTQSHHAPATCWPTSSALKSGFSGKAVNLSDADEEPVRRGLDGHSSRSSSIESTDRL